MSPARFFDHLHIYWSQSEVITCLNRENFATNEKKGVKMIPHFVFGIAKLTKTQSEKKWR